jgi:NAD(P)-dependent dehydrogenase (short-subunit alcohol dehydrogenase family)
MRSVGAGAIVNVSSIAGTKVIVGSAVYNASKSAVAMLSRTAAAEEGPNGIRINEVAPGPVDTPMLRGFFDHAAQAGTDGGLEQIRQTLPLRRIGEPDDIAGAVLFLCSDRARYITGACLAVDGGFLVS